MYTFENLKEDVRKEAEALRHHATAEELGLLNFSRLRPKMPTECIYGQMTGNCYSERSAHLISKCTPKVYDHIYDLNNCGSLDYLNVLQVDQNFIRQRTTRNGMDARYSAIEVYILLPEAKNANLIAYLRGETETLDL